MYSTISLPGFKFEMPVKPHICPACGKETEKVHDYRMTKMKHLKMME